MIQQLKKIGRLKTKKSKHIKTSRISLGFEKLDRDMFEPEKAYDFVGELGVKYIRLQSGWQKTETQKGVYDFAWLDKVVDKFISMGIEPWLCLCYGNGLYTESAKEVFGGVGCPPINTLEEKNAWANYVKSTVEHFKGRIHYYEVWNEPDGEWCWKHGVNAKELYDFTKLTAKACKEADDLCEVIGMVTCHAYSDYLDELCELGIMDEIDVVCYHAYGKADATYKFFYDNYDNRRKKYKPSIKMIQGESGGQSRPDGWGALWGGAWTELKQAKITLRRIIIELSENLIFTSQFSCMDMAEALHGKEGDASTIKDFGFFGLLGADFSSDGKSTGEYHPKLAYYALQNLCAILCEEYKVKMLDIRPISEFSQRMLGQNYDFNKAQKYYFERENGSGALFYWVDKNVLTETYDGETSFKIKIENGVKKLSFIDVLDGCEYELDGEHFYIEDGYYRFKNLPITDSPLLIIFGNFLGE